mgnify:CR=1 FL=1
MTTSPDVARGAALIGQPDTEVTVTRVVDDRNRPLVEVKHMPTGMVVVYPVSRFDEGRAPGSTVIGPVDDPVTIHVGSGYTELTVARLRVLAADRGLDIPVSWSKPKIIEALEAAALGLTLIADIGTPTPTDT